MKIIMVSRVFFIFSTLSIVVTNGLPVENRGTNQAQSIPLELSRDGVNENDYNTKLIAERVASWTPEDKQNAWELSGLFEGDIMMSPNDEITKNGLLDESMRWPGGVVPILIEKNDFEQEEIQQIKLAILEYHQRTCLRFRSYNKSDDDYVLIKGSDSGCWSSVGRKGKAQVLNLQKKGCMRHGTIVHEFLHALGFYHQQSSFDRDEYVNIYWNNIEEGKEHNFNKYDTNTITDYNVGYDYGSVMHYSAFAFSKNGNRTIVTLDENAEIGQRAKLSDKDVTKLQAMYKEECGDRQPEGTNETIENALADSLEWLLNSIDY